MPSSNWDVLLRFIAQDKTGPGIGTATKGLNNLYNKVKNVVAGYLSLRGAQEALKFVKLGAEVSRAATSLNSLAKASGTTGSEIIKSMQGASQFTIDRMTAMQVANRALIMDVAETPEQFERLTKVATTLGRAMGKDAASSIDDFVTAAGRQSKLIADNLGLIINADDAYKKYAQSLGKTSDALTDAEKKQAFLNEMLRQGEIKMGALDSTTRDAAGDIEAFSAALADMKTGSAQAVAEMIRLGGGVDGVMARLRLFPETLRQVGTLSIAWSDGLGEIQRGLWSLDNPLDAVIAGWEEFKNSLKRSTAEGESASEILRYMHTTALPELTNETAFVTSATERYLEQLGWFETASYEAATGADALTRANIKAAKDGFEPLEKAVNDARDSLLDFSASYSDYIRDEKAEAADYAKDAEDIEAEHQDKLNDIRKKGQSYAVKIDETAEWEKLEHLEDRLAQALQAQSEYTDKTKLSTRMAKEHSIEDLQGQLATQTKLLDDYNGGRLIKQGQNITSLLSAEDARYQEELRMLEASRIEQEAEQQRSLGQMLLNHWEAWATANNIGANEMMNMRLKISQEYGLITDAGYNAAQKQIDAWNIQYGVADSFFEMVMRRYNALPSEKVIRIRYEMSTPQVADPDRLGGEVMQHGGISSGRSTWVGERGPELVRLPPGSRVNSAAQSRSITNNYNLSLGTSARSAGIMADFATMRVMGG